MIALVSLRVCGFAMDSASVKDGARLYKKCAVCHGERAEKTYLGVVPLKDIPTDLRIQFMREYSEGKRNVYGKGALMKMNLRGLKEKDFQSIESYIEGLELKLQE